MSYQPEIDKIREILQLYQTTWIEGDHKVSAPSLAIDIKEATGEKIDAKRLERFLSKTRPLEAKEISILREFLCNPHSKGYYCGVEHLGRDGISAPAEILNIVNPKQESTLLQDALCGKSFNCLWQDGEKDMYASFTFSVTDVNGILKVDLCRRAQGEQLSLELEKRLRPTHNGWAIISDQETGTIYVKRDGYKKHSLTYAILALDYALEENQILSLLEQEFPYDTIAMNGEDGEIISRVDSELIHNFRIIRASSLSTRATAGVKNESE